TRYRMVAPVEYNWFVYWFKLPVFDNHFELYFQDQAQQKWDEMIRELESKVHSSTAISKKWLRKNVPKTDNEMDRLTQSIVEVMGNSSFDKLDVIAMAIQPELKGVGNVFYEMLYEYIQLRVNNQNDVIKHRNICF